MKSLFADTTSRVFSTLSTFLIFILLFSLTAPAHADKLMPIDESGSVPGFSDFKKQLLEAVKNHDKKFIHSIISENITISFGRSCQGLRGFKEKYDIDNPDNEFWHIMGKIINLGGTWNSQNNEMVFPYVFLRFPGRYDGTRYSAITGSGVNVRSEPDIHSRVIAVLSYDIVKAQDNSSVWTKIETPEGKTGYVYSDFVHSPIDYRAMFKKIGGSWKMTFFVAGD